MKALLFAIVLLTLIGCTGHWFENPVIEPTFSVVESADTPAVAARPHERLFFDEVKN